MSRAVAVTLALGLAFSCTPGPEVDPDGELRLLGAEPALHHLDPQQASFTNEVSEVSLLFDTLLTYDPSGVTLVAGLASALPTVTSDGLTYSVRLRDGVAYSDGQTLRAADFVFAFRHLCDPATASDFAFAGFIVAGCERYRADDPVRTPAEQLARDRDAVGVIATDDHTLTYHLTARATYFPHLLASWLTAPTREDVVAKGEAWTEAETLVGNGYFRLASWTHRREMIFERNEQHRPKAKLKRIVMQLATSAAGALAAYRGGDLDVLPVNVDLKREVDSDSTLGSQLVARDTTCTSYFALNVRRPPFDDAAVRLAFARSFDRTAWARDALADLGAPLATFIPPGVPGYDASDAAQAFDPTAARALLATSRYAGSPPAVALTYPATAARLAQLAADQWRNNLGVDVQLSPEDPTTLRELSRRPETYPQLSMQGWCAAYPDPQNFLALVFTSVSAVGHTNYASSAYDRLIRQADAESDIARRAALYRDAQRLLTKDAPAIFVSYARALTLVSPRVHGQNGTSFDRVFSQFTLGELFVSPRAKPTPK